MSPKRKKPASRPVQPRSARKATTALPKATIAALKGWQTRRREDPARWGSPRGAVKRAAEFARRRRIESAEHGAKARKATERLLTAEQLDARRRDAERIERAERRRKKAARSTAPEPSSARRPAVSHRLPRSSSSRATTATKNGKNSTRTHRQTSTRTKSPAGSVSFGGSGDRLKVQISVHGALPAGLKATNRLLYEAIAWKIDNGLEDHPRFPAEIIRWQNPGRRQKEDREWRSGNQEDAWITLGPAIRAAIARAYPDI